MKKQSLLALIICYLVLAGTHFLYYPKWKAETHEATISWDVSGYYFYLPAFFIYQDVKELSFKDSIMQKYAPTPYFGQAFEHEESGNYVFKYSMGQAILYLPSFVVAHAWASSSQAYPADGFSFPYQFMISMNALLFAFLGLLVLRKVLLRYFSDGVVALALLSVVLATNYLNYSAIDGAMTHNHLFTLYALLLYSSIRFYEKASYGWALSIGLLVGLATLTRPTELLTALIPLFWQLDFLSRSAIAKRLAFFKQQLPKLGLAVVAVIAVGMLQLLYWKYTANEWIVYSYEDQGFSWLRPHFYAGLLSYKAGWLVYTPFMVFALMGFVFALPRFQSSKVPKLRYC